MHNEHEGGAQTPSKIVILSCGSNRNYPTLAVVDAASRDGKFCLEVFRTQFFFRFQTERGTVYAPLDVDSKRQSMSRLKAPPAPPNFNIE